jgi:outer membrane PBP1 activator LpoA protein
MQEFKSLKNPFPKQFVKFKALKQSSLCLYVALTLPLSGSASDIAAFEAAAML